MVIYGAMTSTAMQPFSHLIDLAQVQEKRTHTSPEIGRDGITSNFLGELIYLAHSRNLFSTGSLKLCYTHAHEHSTLDTRNPQLDARMI